MCTLDKNLQKQLVSDAESVVDQVIADMKPVSEMEDAELEADLRASLDDITNLEQLLGKIHALHALPDDCELVKHIKARIEGNRQIVEKIEVEMVRRGAGLA